MADYVNYQDGEQTQWNKPESHMGIICRNKEEEEKEKHEYYNEGKAKSVYYNDSWGQELGLPGEMTDSPSPAHSTDSIYDLASNSATTDSDGYEIPVSTIDRLNRLNGGAKLSENTDRKWEKGQTDELRQSTNPLPEARVKRHDVGAVGKKTKPVPTKRKNKSAFQDSTYCLAKSDSSLDSIDMSSSPSQNPKKTLSRQKVIYQVKGGSGQLHANAKEPRKRSQDRKAQKQGHEPQSHGVPLAQKEVIEKSKEQKSVDQFRHARSNSTTSDHFEDALEYLPDDWAPAKLKSKETKMSHAGGSGRSKVNLIDPVTGGNYEDAWDLNPRLEAKLSSLKLMHPRPETAAESLNEGNYQDPWDLTRKQQELEEKIQEATKGRDGGGCGRASSFAQSSRERRQDGCDIRRTASQVLQSPRGTEYPGHPLRSSCSLRSAPGCLEGPVNSTDCLQNQEWYHGNILRTDAEDMLRVCKEGSYLVRDSSDRCHYTLSIKSSSQIIHIQIEQSVTLDGSMRYILGHHSRAFSTVPSMIQHYNSHPVPIKGAQHMKLLYSVPYS